MEVLISEQAIWAFQLNIKGIVEIMDLVMGSLGHIRRQFLGRFMWLFRGQLLGELSRDWVDLSVYVVANVANI